MLKINTNEELIYAMRFYGISKVPVFDGQKHYCGNVVLKDGKLVYEKNNAGWYWTHDFVAFQVAHTSINEVIELNDALKRPASVVAVSHVERQVWMYADYEGGPVGHHVYPKTEVTETEEVWEGNTLDDVFVRMYKANNTLRYCNGHSWHFKDADVDRQYYLWHLTMDRSRSFNLYYDGGIVD